MAAEKLETRIRREQIVQAALTVVSTDGLANLNVGRVARRVGLVPSALYRHFSGKDEILDAVMATVQDRLLENVRAARDEADDTLGRLHRLLVRHLALIRDNPGLPRLVFSDEAYAGRPARRVRMFKAVRAYLDRVAALLREGQRLGDVREDLDPGAAALLFLGLVQPAAILSRLGGDAFDTNREVKRSWEVFASAIRRP